MSETQGTALLGAVPGYHRHHALFQVAVGKKGLQIEMTVPAGPMWLRLAQVSWRGEQRNRVAGSGQESDRKENLDHSGQRLSQRLKVRCSRSFWTA